MTEPEVSIYHFEHARPFRPDIPEGWQEWRYEPIVLQREGDTEWALNSIYPPVWQVVTDEIEAQYCAISTFERDEHDANRVLATSAVTRAFREFAAKEFGGHWNISKVHVHLPPDDTERAVAFLGFAKQPGWKAMPLKTGLEMAQSKARFAETQALYERAMRPKSAIEA